MIDLVSSGGGGGGGGGTDRLHAGNWGLSKWEDLNEMLDMVKFWGRGLKDRPDAENGG